MLSVSHPYDLTMNRKNTRHSDFKGFDDFIELFEAGTRTDSARRTATWTTADLDQMVANHSAADAAPIVIGHPKDDASSFAYGWTEQLKRVGKKLLGKFTQVDPEFEQLVKDGKVKNRSIRILKGPNGFKLGHVGWLGATPPAVSGLKPVEFASADEVFDFSMDEWRSTSIMARMLRNLREFLIGQYGQEKADAVLPNYDIDELNRLSEQQFQEEQAEQQIEQAEPGISSSFSQPQDHAMTITQADLDAEKQRADAASQQAADFAAQNQTLEQQLEVERTARRRTEFQTLIDGHKKRGVAPALLEGAVDFMLQLDDGDAGVFEFSAGDAKKSVKQVEFVENLLKALPVAVKPGLIDFSCDPAEGDVADFAAPSGVAVDQESLKMHSQVLAYQAQHKCDYSTAVKAVIK
jgi:hypothetical protein